MDRPREPFFLCILAYAAAGAFLLSQQTGQGKIWKSLESLEPLNGCMDARLTGETMSKPRAFISYSHENGDAFEAIRVALESRGLIPWSDCDLTPHLAGFTEQIKSYIAHSHVFLPILTPESHARGWVHQEIGFAVAMKVPVVPICIGSLPDGMIQMSQAVVLNSLADGLEKKLGRVRFEDLVAEAGLHWQPPSESALEIEDRALLLERYADEARRFIGHQCVRQAGGFSSFSLPDESSGHAHWIARWADKPRGANTATLLRRERRALEAHAKVGGCKLVVSLGTDIDQYYGLGAKHARFSIFLDFLERLQLAPGLVQVVLLEKYPPHSLLTVGDWFVAESRAGRFGRGFQQTLFTAHAPSVTRQVEEFDHDMRGWLDAQGTSAEDSREWAIQRLRVEVSRLEPHPSWPRKRT